MAVSGVDIRLTAAAVMADFRSRYLLMGALGREVGRAIRLVHDRFGLDYNPNNVCWGFIAEFRRRWLTVYRQEGAMLYRRGQVPATARQRL